MKIYCFIWLLLFSTIANATNHEAASIEEANHWLNDSKPNDTITLKDGVYKNAIIKFTNNNIVFIAQHLGQVFFQENSTLNFAGENNKVEGFVWQNGGKDLNTKSVIEFKNGSNVSNHATLINCAIQDYNTTDLNTDNKWVSIFGQYNMVTQCLFKSKFNRGATLVVWLDGKTEAHHTITYNYFLDRQNGPNADNGLESMRIGDSKTSFTPAHCVVALNRFEQCDGEIEIISNKSCNNSYLHNSFVNCNGGLTLRHGNNCLVDGNFFDGMDKPKSYGIRFIGEGHIAINNYFYQLHGAPSEAFRAPVTILNGLVNTPLNGYYQVRRAVIANNVFVNCSTPNIRVGAFSKREGMTVSPDTITIKNNLFVDDAGMAGEIYQELAPVDHLYISGNKIIGKYLKANNKGFALTGPLDSKFDRYNKITDGKNYLIYSHQNKEVNKNHAIGANWVELSLTNTLKKSKFTVVTFQMVGPIFNR